MPLPDPARYARDAAEAIGARFEDLDNGAGYLFRVSRNGRSVLAGAGSVASFPVNSATAVSIARDKAHAKTVLASLGLPVIPGGLFFAHRRRVALRGPGREIEDAVRFAQQLGYPVFCKPNAGARGNFAEIIATPEALADYAQRVALEFESFLVEPVISAVEHRVLVQDGEPVFHTVKGAPFLTGDGERTLACLLEESNARLSGSGVSPYPAAMLEAAGHDLNARPAAAEHIELPGRRNLSSEGEIARFSTEVPAPLRELASSAAAALGLRVAAVDLFDASASADFSGLLVVEVNGNPGLRTPELAGRYDLVLKVWTSMLEELLGD